MLSFILYILSKFPIPLIHIVNINMKQNNKVIILSAQKVN